MPCPLRVFIVAASALLLVITTWWQWSEEVPQAKALVTGAAETTKRRDRAEGPSQQVSSEDFASVLVKIIYFLV